MRRPSIASAGVDLAGLAVAFAAGLFGGGVWVAAAVLAAALALWGWTRRRALAAMPLNRRMANGAIAIIMIGVVLALFYWIGLLVGGHA
ncbi:MAG: hypothetical protein AB7P07_10135 [Hyphomonadaceae bacterium]